MTTLVFIDEKFPDGRITDATKPHILATSPGLIRGDGVFETMLATVSGEPKTLTVRKIEAHLQRLDASAEKLDLSLPGKDRWRRAVAAGLESYLHTHTTAEIGDTMVRLVALRGEASPENPQGTATCWVSICAASEETIAQRSAGIDVLLLNRGYDSTLTERAPWLLFGAKTLSYAVNMAALRYARRHGADDVIFTSNDNKILEGPTSTVLLARLNGDDKELLTPAREIGILAGTTQKALFTEAERHGWRITYQSLTPDDLYAADALWLTSSVRLLAPVNTLNGRPVGNPGRSPEEHQAIRAKLTVTMLELFKTVV